MKNTIITIIIAALVSFGVLHYVPIQQTATDKTETVYERVQRTGILRCGYNTEPPMLSIDANTGKTTGAMVDVIERMASLLGWKVEWAEQVGWTEMTAGLAANRYDLACNGKWIFASQTKGAAFTMPLYFTATYAYGRADEVRFDQDLSQLNSSNYAIAVIDGEFNYYVAQSRFANARRVELPALVDKAMAIENVVTGKADAIFLAAFEADDYMAKNPGKIKKLSDKPVTVFDTALMYKAGEVQFAEMLDAALRQLRGDGFIDDTLAKYGVSPATTLRVATPYKLP